MTLAASLLVLGCVAPEDTETAECEAPEPPDVAECTALDATPSGYSSPYEAWAGQKWAPEGLDADVVAVRIGPLACPRTFNALVFYAWTPDYSEEALNDMAGPFAVSLWTEDDDAPTLYPLPHNVQSFAVPCRLTTRAYVAPHIVRVVVPIETTIGPGNVFAAVYPPSGLSIVATTEPPPEARAFKLDDVMSWQPIAADVGIGLYVVPPGSDNHE